MMRLSLTDERYAQVQRFAQSSTAHIQPSTSFGVLWKLCGRSTELLSQPLTA